MPTGRYFACLLTVLCCTPVAKDAAAQAVAQPIAANAYAAGRKTKLLQ